MRRRNPLTVAVILAIVFVLITGAVILLVGYRYSSDEGVKFLGKSENGQPISGTINYPDGSSATLDYLNKTIRYGNGDVYVGDIKGIERNGTGKMSFAATGDVYEGSFLNDKMTGTCVMTYANGDKYVGTIQDGKKHGRGVMTFANGSVYDGNYENDTMNGNGTFTWSSGATYTGSFENEMKSGKGIMTFASGDKYTGDFAMDMRNGNGHYQWANGSYYVGAFRNNLMDTRLVDEKGAFVVDENGEYVHGEVAYYTIVSEDGNRTFVGYFENGKIAAVYNKTEEGA